MRTKGNRGLLESSVGPATLKSYRTALASFLAWLQEEGVVRVRNFAALDDLLVDYFEFILVASGRKGRHHAVNARSAVLLFLPNARWSLNGSARALKGWSRLKPSKQRPPMPWELATLIVEYFRKAKLPELEWTFRACFEGYLRLSEAIGVKVGDLDVSGPEGVPALPKSKTGLNQSVVIHPGDWLNLTRLLLDRPLKAGARVVSISAHKFRRGLQSILKRLGVTRVRYTPHSLRHGGATRDFMLGIPIADIVVRGRWAQAKTASRYIQQGRALLVKMSFSKRLRASMRSVSSRILAKEKFGALGMLPPKGGRSKRK